MREFDREYCHEVKSVCLQAIANTSFGERAKPHETLHTAEIKSGLIDILGTITAMVEEFAAKGYGKKLGQGLAAQFAASFHATRASRPTEELDLLREARARSRLFVASLITIITQVLTCGIAAEGAPSNLGAVSCLQVRPARIVSEVVQNPAYGRRCSMIGAASIKGIHSQAKNEFRPTRGKAFAVSSSALSRLVARW